MLDLFPPAEIQPHPRTLGEYCLAIWRTATEDFKVRRDMAIGATIALLTIILQAFLGLIALADWQSHKWQWILSVVVPFAAVVVFHFFWRLVKAPYDVYRELADRSEKAATEFRAQISELKQQVRRLEERLDDVPLMRIMDDDSFFADVRTLYQDMGEYKRPIGDLSSIHVNFKNDPKRSTQL